MAKTKKSEIKTGEVKAALDAQRGTTFKEYPEVVQIVGRDTKHKSKADHFLYDSVRAFRSYNENTVEDMVRNGQRTVGECVKDGDALYVSDGRGRVINLREANIRRAAKGLELLKFEFKLKKGDDAALVESMIVQNEHRLENDPITRCENVMQLANLDRSTADIARTMNCTQETVRMYMALAEMSVAVKEWVRAGKISATAAVKFKDLPRSEQLAAIQKLEGEVGAGNMTREVADRASKQARSEKSDAAALGAAPSQSAYTIADKRHLKRLVAAHQSGRLKEFGLDEAAINAFRYLIGDLHPTKIAGLVGALRATDGSINKASE